MFCYVTLSNVTLSVQLTAPTTVFLKSLYLLSYSEYNCLYETQIFRTVLKSTSLKLTPI